MAVNLSLHSRLRFGELLLIEGVEHWDIVDLPEIPEQEDDLEYQVQGGTATRIDRIATKFYGDSRLWWVIAAANGLEVVPTALNEGDILRIPSPRYVLQELFSG